MKDPSILECGCLLFCESHARDDIFTADDGEVMCAECIADGWSGELCHPSAESCCSGAGADRANEWLRSFMCKRHADENRAFCAEVSEEFR